MQSKCKAGGEGEPDSSRLATSTAAYAQEWDSVAVTRMPLGTGHGVVELACSVAERQDLEPPPPIPALPFPAASGCLRCTIPRQIRLPPVDHTMSALDALSSVPTATH
jgi:hypothetical protein